MVKHLNFFNYVSNGGNGRVGSERANILNFFVFTVRMVLFVFILHIIILRVHVGSKAKSDSSACMRLLQRALTEPETCGAVLMSSMCTIVQLENCRIIVQ